jgi:hypothetical protein
LAQSKARAHLCKLRSRAVGNADKAKIKSLGGVFNLAMYSASVKAISRSSGRSATAAAAYRIGGKITDYRTGEIHNYEGRYGVNGVAMHLPAGVAKMTSEALWNAVEAAEKRKNATVARELLVALPSELTTDARLALAEHIALELVERYQVGAEVAVHLPDREGDQRNHHTHILFTTRRIGPAGFGEKTRELDDLKRGPEEVRWIRAMVERCTNGALSAAGQQARVDCRSLMAQRAAALSADDQVQAQVLDRLPTVHEGPRVTQIRRECARKSRPPLGQLDRAAINDDLQTLNADRFELGRVQAQIINLEAERAKRRVRDQRINWLMQELQSLESAPVGYQEVEQQVLRALDERLAQAHRGLHVFIARKTDVDWLAQLWQEAINQALQSAVLDASSKRRLQDMLSRPLPNSDVERRQHWLRLSAELKHAESADLAAAEQFYETPWLGSYAQLELEEASDESDLWHTVQQARIDAIRGALNSLQQFPVRTPMASDLFNAFRGLLADVQALTPKQTSLVELQQGAKDEQYEITRLNDWLAEQLSTSQANGPSGPRIG